MKWTALFASLSWISLTSAAAIAVPRVEIRQAANDTENQLSGACRPVTFIFARGTGESGNVGTDVGAPLIADLRAALGTANIAAQGVDYAADVLGYLEGGDPAGSKTMASLINQAASQCPSTQIAIGGYSQGAQLVHNAASMLSATVTARIAAGTLYPAYLLTNLPTKCLVVLFGDPDRVGRSTLPPVGTVPAANVDSFCHSGDIICTGSGGATQHLNYDLDAPAASSFIVARV
ncbi:cutinase-domain-containing protein [Mycena sanguinolenta]|nr:cutinase-domain-containing protein [Mycena sanguinolenta]